MALVMRYAARSDVGVVRKQNEDSGYAGQYLLAVADGMGGHAAGELASATAIASFAEAADGPLDEADALSVLGDAVDLASDRIADFIANHPEFQGMGTTFTGLAWLGDRLGLVHVGDSRAYLLRDGELVQLSHDHTYVQTLVDAGQITQEEAATHPRRNLIMRAIDGIHTVEPDLSIRDLKPGDRYLLCSDGLSGVVPEDMIKQVLSRGDPTGTVTTLVDLALEGGAPDNVTVVVADVYEAPDDTPLREELPVVVGAAAEPKNRERLPRVPWPIDEQRDPDAVPGAESLAEPIPVQETTHRSWWRNGIAVVAVVIILAFALIGAGLMYWVSAQWYVGSYRGNVTIFQGVPGEIGPVPLQRVNLETGIAVADLPTFDQQRVKQSIVVSSQDQAINTVAELDSRAQQCRSPEPPVGCPTSEDGP